MRRPLMLILAWLPWFVMATGFAQNIASPETVFLVTAQKQRSEANKNKRVLHFSVPAGYLIYRDSVQVVDEFNQPVSAEHLNIAQVKPKHRAAYFQDFELVIAHTGSKTLTITRQGCDLKNDICYQSLSTQIKL